MGVEVKQGRGEGPIAAGSVPAGPLSVSERGPVTYQEGQAPTVEGRPLEDVQADVQQAQQAQRAAPVKSSPGASEAGESHVARAAPRARKQLGKAKSAGRKGASAKAKK